MIEAYESIAAVDIDDVTYVLCGYEWWPADAGDQGHDRIYADSDLLRDSLLATRSVTRVVDGALSDVRFESLGYWGWEPVDV